MLTLYNAVRLRRTSNALHNVLDMFWTAIYHQAVHHVLDCQLNEPASATIYRGNDCNDTGSLNREMN